MKRNNKIFNYLLVLATLVSCGSVATTQEEKPSEENLFVSTVESNLNEYEDYYEHSTTYDGKKFEYDNSAWYINNLDKVPLPDPHVFVEDGTYYIVGTSDRSGCKVVDCYYTTDFVTYNHSFGIYNPSSFKGWENSNPEVYAPEMYCFDGVYYLYYSAKNENGVRENSVVQADNPLGPYEPIVNNEVNGLNAPLFKDNTVVLDSTIFVDDDGSMYMYYSAVGYGQQYIAGIKLTSPYQADYSTRKDLVIAGNVSTEDKRNLLSWEKYRSYPIVEAPYMIKSPNGEYYLTYSANGCWEKYYNVCYAVSDDPLGNFVKPYEEDGLWTNLLLGYSGTNDSNSTVFNQWSGFASGTGHHCFFNIGDQIMIGYHAHKNRKYNAGGGFMERYFAMDPLYFDSDGVPYCNGPSYSLQPLPEAISGYKNVASNATIKVQNVTNETALIDNYIVDCYNLESEENEVQLGEGLSYIELTFDKEYEIGGVAVYNSAYYEKTVMEMKYLNLLNGNAIRYPQFCYAYYNEDTEFTFPNSAFTFEFSKQIKSNKLVLCFELDEPCNINEIVVLGQ